MISDLANKKCVPCEGGTQPLEGEELALYATAIDKAWRIDDDKKKIRRRWKLGDFNEALAFVNGVGKLAEEEGHHPDIHVVNYNQVEIVLWTHAVGGLSVNDFVMASKIDRMG